jgi:hypothetical protein
LADRRQLTARRERPLPAFVGPSTVYDACTTLAVAAQSRRAQTESPFNGKELLMDALTAIFANIGIQVVDSDLATLNS